MIPLPMSRRGCKGKQHIFLRQRSGKLVRAHIVAHEDHVLRPVRPQRLQNRAQLRIAQDNENHVIRVVRRKPGHHRDPADRYAG